MYFQARNTDLALLCTGTFLLFHPRYRQVWRVVALLRLATDVVATCLLTHMAPHSRRASHFTPHLPQDELTMDNISRSGLVNMCRYMGLPPFGNDNFLRYCLRSKLRAITQARLEQLGAVIENQRDVIERRYWLAALQ